MRAARRFSQRPGSMTGERRLTWSAALAYTAIAVAFTWPLASGLTRDVPSDLGDPLLNMWILSWEAEQLGRLLTGHPGVLSGWFDANIFHPAPDALAYSEHLFAQAVQILPVYAITGNPILCYNLLFLSTYVLSGLGTYLLVRELTADRRAAFVAGLLFAFAPYRLAQLPHLQILSSQWMPFALYGFTRYLNAGSRPALAGGAIALLAQNLSSVYYLVYFPPLAAAYLLWELARRRRLRDLQAWRDIALALLAAGAATAPFLIPYVRVQSVTRLARRIEEVSLYSADVYAYLTAAPTLRLWGDVLQLAPRAEGELFLGAVPVLLTLAAAALMLRRGWRKSTDINDPYPAVSAILAITATGVLVLLMAGIFAEPLDTQLLGIRLRTTDLGRVVVWLIVSSTVTILWSSRAQRLLRACVTVEAFLLLSIVLAWWFSLGPTPQSLGRRLNLPPLYALLYPLPGVDGIRVPARLAMVIALLMAVATGCVLARLRGRRYGMPLTAAVAVLFLAEAWPSHISINGQDATFGHALPDAHMQPPASAPAVYHAINALPADSVVLELPIGDLNWDVRAVYYSVAHWRKLVNGYSGFFPRHYDGIVQALVDPPADADAAWKAVTGSGATHVLVHQRAYRSSEADQLDQWLTAGGARAVVRRNDDVLYALP